MSKLKDAPSMSVSSSKDEETKSKRVIVVDSNPYFKLIDIHPQTLAVKIITAEKMNYGYDKENEREIYREVPYTVSSPFQANREMISAMKKLVKHSLTLLELENEESKVYNVSGIKITGSIPERNASIVLKMRRDIGWSNKPVKMITPPFSLYTEGGIETKDIVKDLEALFKATWSYMEGNHSGKEQLKLFTE